MFDLKRFRKDFKLGQKDIQDVLNCTQGFISHVETGRKSLSEEQILILLSKYKFDRQLYANNITVEDENNTNQSNLDSLIKQGEINADVHARNSMNMERLIKIIEKQQETINNLSK